MNKREFLSELENALDGRLPESDIKEILSDYGDIFDNNTAAGKSEEVTAEEIGSPARIARTILGDGSDQGREYTDFQKKINEKTSRIFDKVIEPVRNVEIGKLAPMSHRLFAYLIDSILLGAVAIGAILALYAPFLYFTGTGMVESRVITTPMGPMGSVVMNGEPATRFMFANLAVLFLLFSAFNLFTTIFLWATNGFTPGKYILNMRVVKISGDKISFFDALLRELIIKCIANSLLSGFLNIGSFIWGCATDDHKTVHDLVARTRVVKWDRTLKKPSKSFNPLES